MTGAEAKRVAREIAAWRRADREWWRRLLDEHPGEAAFAAEIVRMFPGTKPDPYDASRYRRGPR